MSNMTRGTKIKVTGSEIFSMLGYRVVTGTVFIVGEHSLHFKCDQTGAMEIVSFGDGKLEAV
jgi:hypothetical protein